jgi:hypothetical protein
VSQTTDSASREADDYLRELDRALTGMAEPQRSALTGEITDQIEAARQSSQPEREVTRTIRRLGAPADISAAAGHRAPRLEGGGTFQPSGASPQEWFALVCLSVGSYILPIVGWVLGAIVLWSSRRWTSQEKLFASAITVFEPILLVLAFTLDSSWVAFLPLILGSVPAIAGCVFLYRRLQHPERLLAPVR